MKHLAIVFCALVPGLSLAASQSHEAAPMMAPAQKPLTDSDLKNERSAPQRQESEDAILDRFRAAFDGSMPRVAVFWNRAFDDQVSDWRSNTRGVLSARGSLNGSVPDGNVDLQGQSQVAAQGEYPTRSAPAW